MNTLTKYRLFDNFYPAIFYGGCSSVVECQIVVLAVAGSITVIHPQKLLYAGQAGIETFLRPRRPEPAQGLRGKRAGRAFSKKDGPEA